MASELERRLEEALRGLPGPDAESRERARRCALEALGRPARRRRGLTLPVVAVAAGALVAGTALAAPRLPALRAVLDSARPTHHHRPPTPATTAGRPGRAALPAGTNGIGVLAGGRLWLRTARAGGVHGRPLSAVDVSPNALYLAAGRGGSLAATSTDLRHTVWRQRTDGEVVQAAWAPARAPIQIAFLVRRRGGFALHLIDADGELDRRVDAGAAPVRPSWRGDALAVAYVSVKGRLLVRDLVHERIVAPRLPRSCRGRVVAVAFAPDGGLLAAALGDGHVALVSPGPVPARCLAPARGAGHVGIAWATEHDLLVAVGRRVVRVRASATGTRRLGAWVVPAPVLALTASPDGRALALAIADAGRVDVVQAPLPPLRGSEPLPASAALLRVPLRRPVALFWR